MTKNRDLADKDESKAADQLAESHVIDSPAQMAQAKSGRTDKSDKSDKSDNSDNLTRQGDELADKGIIPKLALHDDLSAASALSSNWQSARLEAMRESNQTIGAGQNLHTIRFGDTMWDIATASMKKQTGHAPQIREIAEEVARLAKKNAVNANSIALGTKIDTSPDNPGMQSFKQYFAAVDHRLPTERPNMVPAEVPDKSDQTEKSQIRVDVPVPIVEVVGEARKNDFSWQDSHNSLKAKAAAGAPDIAFYGDSLTAGLSLNNDFARSLGGHAENFGINGDSTENLLYRLQNGEADFPAKKPDTAVILIGTNNLGYEPNEKIVAGILANAKEAAIKMPDTQLIVLGLLPRGQSAADPVRERINAINNLVRDQLDGVKNVKFVDISEHLLDSRGDLPADLWQPDHLHLTYGAGYSAMLKALRPELIKH